MPHDTSQVGGVPQVRPSHSGEQHTNSPASASNAHTWAASSPAHGCCSQAQVPSVRSTQRSSTVSSWVQWVFGVVSASQLARHSASSPSICWQPSPSGHVASAHAHTPSSSAAHRSIVVAVTQRDAGAVSGPHAVSHTPPSRQTS